MLSLYAHTYMYILTNKKGPREWGKLYEPPQQPTVPHRNYTHTQTHTLSQSLMQNFFRFGL